MILRRPTCFLLPFLFMGTPPIPAQTPVAPSPPPVYASASQALAARDYRRAADLFAAAAAAESNSIPHAHSDALLMEAKALVHLGDFPAADTALRGYLQREARSSAALYLLGYVLQRENKPKESLAMFTQAAAIKPPLPDDLKLVGLDYILLDDYIDGIHWLERSVAADPANEEAWYDLGRARMHQGSFEGAEKAFSQALKLNPQNSRALDNLGLAYEAENRTDEALSAYARSIEAQKGAPGPSEQPLLNLGTLLNTKNRSAEALPPLRQAVALAPGSSRCYEELSRAYSGTSQDQPALAAMEQAVALDPKNPRLHFQLGRLYRHSGQSSRAEAEFKLSSVLYGTRSTPAEN